MAAHSLEKANWPEEPWDALNCSGCGKPFALAHRVYATAYTIKTLLRNSMRSLRLGA